MRCQLEKVMIDKHVIFGLRGGSCPEKALLIARHRQGAWQCHLQARALQPQHRRLSIPEQGADGLQISEEDAKALWRRRSAVRCAVQRTPDHADGPTRRGVDEGCAADIARARYSHENLQLTVRGAAYCECLAIASAFRSQCGDGRTEPFRR
jgi:hypothetical protein